ncbi:MAG: transglycosylase SLT domain-containing protein [Alphaproteobacteria bacterium]|nr:transglycosylase SLT domain-containing protein [Alphaproteobacteria bacterium]
MICGTFATTGMTKSEADQCAQDYRDTVPAPTTVTLEQSGDGTWTVTAAWPPCESNTAHAAQPLAPAVASMNMVGGQLPAAGATVQSADSRIAWGRSVEPGFKQAVLQMCERLTVDPNFLMACMAFETGQSFRPDKVNPVSGATGLIQFMPSTANALGTTTADLAGMTAVQQIASVEEYFSPYAGKLNTLSDVYMAILWPKAVGKPESYILFEAPSKAYLQNQGLDSNNDGHVTKAEAVARPQQQLIAGMSAVHLG